MIIYSFDFHCLHYKTMLSSKRTTLFVSGMYQNKKYIFLKVIGKKKDSERFLANKEINIYMGNTAKKHGSCRGA
ncbi:hypothetical protein D0466_14310 [Peribacillus glennii]|uniref:Uncharacterized protein n=1 Tax=Peribacillus glennii TaxID=2303991 RepID=A0A372LAM1_9BACI|nr:hypothetical protein D0466_14310 [Peribacillus glennii]